MATSIPTRYGMIFKITSKPPLAPSIKASNTFIFLSIPPIIMSTTSNNKIILPVTLLNISFCSAPICCTKKSIPATSATRPNNQVNSTLSHFNFCLKPTINMDASVVQIVASTQGINTLAASVEPAAKRYEIMVSGINVSPLVCSTKNMICALVAFSLSGLID